MQPSNVPVVSRKCAVFEKCPSGDPSTTGNANVILEKSPYNVNKIQIKLRLKLFSFKDLITMSNHSLDLDSQKMSTLKLMNESPAQRRIKSNFDEFKDVGHGIIKPI